MNIRCPNCQTVFRVDPARVPATGVRARCARCSATFTVRREQGLAATAAPAAASPPRREPAAAATTAIEPAQQAAQQMGPAVQGSDAAAGESGAAGSDHEAVVPGQDAAAPAQDAAAPAQDAAPRDRGTGMPQDKPTPAGAGPASPAYTPAYAAHRAEVAAPGASVASGPGAVEAKAAGAAAAPRMPVFGSKDPDSKAKRIARALVSDIAAYHPARRDESLQAGTLRADFRDEIMKSWEEYVAQVGLELAKSTPHFRNALNDILARGQTVF
jgi:predicted Zn finger-like uncharacterized protein